MEDDKKTEDARKRLATQTTQKASNKAEMDSAEEKGLFRQADKDSQTAFNKSEMRYRRLFETAYDGILILDFESGKVIDANPYILNMLGIDLKTSIGKELWEIGIFSDIKASKEAFTVLKAVGYIRYEDLPLETPDGVSHEVEFISNAYMDGTDQVIQCNIRDISERKATEDKLAETQEMLNQAQKMEAIGVLVGGIAHDFNNVLAGITGNTYLAKTEIKDHPERLLERLETIEALSFRSANLIKQLLTFARRDRVHMHTLELSPLIKEIYKLIRSGTSEHIAIKFDYSDQQLSVHGDLTQIHQILMNLVNNAVDAVEDTSNPAIAISLEMIEVDSTLLIKHPSCKAGRYACLKVEDNGCGISEGQIGHLFEPFFTTKPIGKGTGLGLAMVFGAVENHHGFIEVRSHEGEGTTFEIYFPITEDEVITESATSELHQGNGETILVVDDEKELVDITCQLLEKLGYKTLTAYNGFEAIDVFTNHKSEIKAIVMDVIMPKFSGLEAVEHIRKENPDVSIIFATGYDQLNSTDGQKVGSSDVVLTKPYSIEALGKAIANIN